MEDWIELNRQNWDERAGPHAASSDYGVERFIADPKFLSGVVTFDVPRLGDIRGLRGVHLQCHIGTDTLSLHRLGARMTGLDFSAAAIEQASSLASRAGADIEYVQSTVDAATDVLPAGEFDLVYTGIGALCWLPNIRDWAQTVATLLRPGGRLFIREGHPSLWSIDDAVADRLVVKYPYWERGEPDVFDEPGTYVDTDHVFTTTRSASWNHGIGEILTALIDAGMQITGFVEHDSVPWDALPGQMELIDGGEYRLRDEPWRLPHSYTLQAMKQGLP